MLNSDGAWHMIASKRESVCRITLRKIQSTYRCGCHNEQVIQAPKLPNRSRKLLHHIDDELSLWNENLIFRKRAGRKSSLKHSYKEEWWWWWVYRAYLLTFFDTDRFVSKSPEMSYSPNTVTSDARNPGWQWAKEDNTRRDTGVYKNRKLQFSKNVDQVSTMKKARTKGGWGGGWLMIMTAVGEWIFLFNIVCSYLLWVRTSWKLKHHRIYSSWRDPAMYFRAPEPAKETRLLRH